MVGIFAIGDGLIYSGSFDLLKIQLLGVAATAIWTIGMSLIVFNAIKKTIGLRVSKEEEIIGLDIEEHGLVSSYADFELKKAS